eukprot:1975080-Pyramimonas_sp.AAC.1
MGSAATLSMIWANAAEKWWSRTIALQCSGAGPSVLSILHNTALSTLSHLAKLLPIPAMVRKLEHQALRELLRLPPNSLSLADLNAPSSVLAIAPSSVSLLGWASSWRTSFRIVNHARQRALHSSKEYAHNATIVRFIAGNPSAPCWERPSSIAQ